MTKEILQDTFLQDLLVDIETRMEDLPNVLNPFEYMKKDAELNLLIELKDKYVKHLEAK